jgi:hypothetical protein
VTYFRFTPQWFQVALWPFLANGGRRTCVVWHRRAGKDELAMAFLARMMLLEPGSYWILYPTITQAKNVLWSMRVGNEARIDRIFPVAYSENKAQGEAFFDAEYGANFTAAVPGAFYSGELKHLEAEGRIRPLEIERPVLDRDRLQRTNDAG